MEQMLKDFESLRKLAEEKGTENDKKAATFLLGFFVPMALKSKEVQDRMEYIFKVVQSLKQ
jgi:hypothetical protein